MGTHSKQHLLSQKTSGETDYGPQVPHKHSLTRRSSITPVWLSASVLSPAFGSDQRRPHLLVADSFCPPPDSAQPGWTVSGYQTVPHTKAQSAGGSVSSRPFKGCSVAGTQISAMRLIKVPGRVSAQPLEPPSLLGGWLLW